MVSLKEREQMTRDLISKDFEQKYPEKEEKITKREQKIWVDRCKGIIHCGRRCLRESLWDGYCNRHWEQRFENRKI